MTEPVPIPNELVPSPIAPDSVPVSVQPVPLEDIAGHLTAIQKQMEFLQLSFEAKVRDDANRQAVIDRLHAALEEAKADQVWKITRPILADLVMIRDALAKAIQTHTPPEGQDIPSLVVLLAEIRQDIEDTFFRHGVEAYTCPGERFDPRRQKAVRTPPAPTPEDVGRVTDRLAPGFAAGDRILRPELVTVYAAPPPTTSQKEEPHG